MSDRGSYRPIYDAIVHDREWLGFPPEARLLFFVLKVTLGPSGIDVVYDGALEAQTGVPPKDLRRAFEALSGPGWVLAEELAPGVRLVWITRGLEFEPHHNLQSENTRKGISRHLRGLPNSSLVKEFCEKYGIDNPRPSEGPPQGPSKDPTKDLPKQENGERRTEIGDRRTEKDQDQTHAFQETPREEADVDKSNGKGERRRVSPEIIKNPWWRDHDDRGEKVMEAMKALVHSKKLEEYALQIAKARAGPHRERIYQVASDILADKRSGELDHTLSRSSMVKAINNR